MKATITTPKQHFSPGHAPKGKKHALHQFLNNPKGTEKQTDACVSYEFKHTDGNADDETKYDTEDCNVDADKNSKSHDYIRLMVTDMFLKLDYIL